MSADAPSGHGFRPQLGRGGDRAVRPDIVVLTGAGISTDSGIPDFRGPDGAWTRDPTAPTRFTYRNFMADPAVRRSYWRSRQHHPAWTAKPNAAHHALAQLVDAGIVDLIITQNTDGLHTGAGVAPDRCIELHGSMRDVVCTTCGDRTRMSDTLDRVDAGDADPSCLRCGGILKAATVMFGQLVDSGILVRAERAVEACALLLVVGTTLRVEPAASLCAAAVGAGASMIIINRDPTPYDSIAADLIREPIAIAVPRVVDELIAARASDANDRAARDRDDTPTTVPTPPSYLLRPSARVTRLRSREAELAWLTDWCRGGGARLHLLTGAYGQGKTRLGIELVRGVRATASAALPRLLVVDDADHHGRDLVRLVREHLADAPSARILVLARRDGEWWQRVRGGLEALGPMTTTTGELGPAERSGRDRSAALREAVEDLQIALTAAGVSAVVTSLDVRPVPDLDLDVTPGVRGVAALAALLGADAGDPVSRDAAIVSHESEHLRRNARRWDLRLPAGVARQALAAAIICGAQDQDAAVAVLQQVPALAGADLAGVARWLQDVRAAASANALVDDASRPYWPFAAPDAVGELLVADAGRKPGFLAALLMETTDAQDRQALAVLTRVADTRLELAQALAGLLSVLPGLAPAAVDVALASATPGPLVDALTGLLRRTPLSADLVDAVPVDSHLLGGFAVDLAGSLEEDYQKRIDRHPHIILPLLARLLDDLGDRLTHLGRTAEARGAGQRAAWARRRIAHTGGAHGTSGTGNDWRPL